MIRNAEVPLPDAIAMASRNPARETGLSDKGEIAIGKDADLVVLSPELEVLPKKPPEIAPPRFLMVPPGVGEPVGSTVV